MALCSTFQTFYREDMVSDFQVLFPWVLWFKLLLIKLSRVLMQDMVPCILVTFENEQIVVWRGKDYEPRKDGYFLKDRESVDDIGGLCVGKEQQAM